MKTWILEHVIFSKESFWLKDGYIMVNFKIDTVKDQQFNSPDLSYYDVPLGNMWDIEGAVRSKVDDNNVTFAFDRGDIILYDLNKKQVMIIRVVELIKMRALGECFPRAFFIEIFFGSHFLHPLSLHIHI